MPRSHISLIIRHYTDHHHRCVLSVLVVVVGVIAVVHRRYVVRRHTNLSSLRCVRVIPPPSLLQFSPRRVGWLDGVTYYYIHRAHGGGHYNNKGSKHMQTGRPCDNKARPSQARQVDKSTAVHCQLIGPSTRSVRHLQQSIETHLDGPDLLPTPHLHLHRGYPTTTTTNYSFLSVTRSFIPRFLLPTLPSRASSLLFLLEAFRCLLPALARVCCQVCLLVF